MRNYNADPIEVASEYSYENVKKFIRITTLSMRRLSLAIGVLAVLNVILLLIQRPDRIAMTDVVGLLAAVLLAPSAIRSHAFSYKPAHFEREAHLCEGHHLALLHTEDLELRSTNTAYDSSGRRVRYDALHRVIETNDALYLLFNARSAVFLEKRGIRNATPEEAVALLRRAVPEKKYSVQK